MEIKGKKKIKKTREEGPNRNKKMRYFKIPLCRNFARKAGDYSDRKTRVGGVLGQKLRYDNVQRIKIAKSVK